jgi:hypothetical protein
MYIDIEDLLGGKQAKQFENDISQVFREWEVSADRDTRRY